ncbi:hypothetical protein B0O99DRAFT_709848 [Bisporella sp. PMI_857]|nr:hypothetical protein B0O99DRAFT_709848 [Bisporella sp. PMI_857]
MSGEQDGKIFDPPRSPPQLVVILKSEAGVRTSPHGITSTDASVNVSDLRDILNNHGATLIPLFGPSEDRVKAQQQQTLKIANAGALQGGEDPSLQDTMRNAHPLSKLPDLSTFYGVQVPDDQIEALQKNLLANTQVAAAYLRPVGVEPIWSIRTTNAADPDPATPNYLDHQLYLNAAPGGIDAKYAGVFPGGQGAGIRVIDCERGWRFSHEDLVVNQGGIIYGSSLTTSEPHGTAVIGIISGDKNAFGIQGITPDAVISASSFNPTWAATTIKKATEKLTAGDVILLEQHLPGPNAKGSGQQGYIPIEWWYDTFIAIQEAVAKGIVVVEAGGNGWENLDDPIYDKPLTGFPPQWKNPFNPANPSSGAVIVGAGAPPLGTHGRDHGADRSRLSFSCWGSRVDVQGWGEEVTSSGWAGDLQGGTNPDLFYTDTFNGTSSASPVVTGALISIQGILKARGRRQLTSHEARRLLRKIGSPQQADTSAPLTQRIGKRPNLRTLIPAAAKFQCRSADFDGDGKAEILVSSPHGIALLKQNANGFQATVVHNNGDRLGGQWLLNTADNIFGPVADFDGDHHAESFVVSPWGIGILKLVGTVMTPLLMKPNGTRFGGWLLNTGDNSFGPAADFDGDGIAEILVTSPWGIGILKRNGSTLTPLMMAPNGTRFSGSWLLNTADNDFSQVGDFSGDGKADILVTSPWGIGILTLDGSTLRVLTMVPNGTRIGGWLLNTADNRFGPVGDFDGDRKAEILLTSPWGIGVLKFNNGAFTNPMLQPNGTRFGGWLLNTADNDFAISRDFDGDNKDEILVVSPWGVGVLKLAGITMTAPMMKPNGTRFMPGGWLLNTANDWLGSGAKFTRTDRSSVLIESPWGIGLLEMSGDTMVAPAMKANGMIGLWKLDTAEHDMGHGV